MQRKRLPKLFLTAQQLHPMQRGLPSAKRNKLKRTMLQKSVQHHKLRDLQPNKQMHAMLEQLFL